LTVCSVFRILLSWSSRCSYGLRYNSTCHL